MTVIAKASRGLERALRAPVLVKACAVAGLFAGLSLGVMVSAPVGLVVGISLGVAIGIAAGVVMDREEKRRQHRVQQLDELRPEVLEDIAGLTPYAPSVEERPDAKAWLTEWMTPPPPQVG